MLEPGVEYHSLIHTLQLMRYFKERYSEFELDEGFEAKLSDQVLLDFINGEVSLEEMLSLFSEGIKRTKECTKQLKNAEQKITVLMKNPDGSMTEEAFQEK